MFSWVDPGGLWNPSLCLWGFPAVPTWQPGISYHSPIVMFPKPRVMSRSLCSLSWCFDSFRTLLAQRSRLVNTEWITPNLKNTRTHCTNSPGKLWAQEMRWRLSMHAHMCTHIHTTLSSQWLRFHLATQALGVATPWTAAYQAPPSMGFPRQEYWRGVPLKQLEGFPKFTYSWETGWEHISPSHVFSWPWCVIGSHQTARRLPSIKKP